MDVSVIIVSYNTIALTINCINSVKQFTSGLSYEIILVDNASSDGTVHSIREKFPEVRLIANEQNIGFGRANNQAIRSSAGKYVFLLNSDAYLINNAIRVFFDFMNQAGNEDVAVCGGDLVSGDNLRMASYGNFPSLLEAFSSIGFHKLYSKFYKSRLSIGVINIDPAIRQVDYISGADMFIRKTALQTSGLFDEDFFLYFEETELSFRIKKSGFKSVLIPSVQVVHLEGASQNKSDNFNYKRFELFTASQLLYFRKTGGGVAAWLAKLIYISRVLIYGVIGKEKGSFIRKAGIIFKA